MRTKYGLRWTCPMIGYMFMYEFMYSLRHDNEFMYEMVICCNVKWPARHGMMAGATRLPP